MWLRDYLPRTLQGTRSIIYGYDTRLISSQSFQTLEDLAISFISKLRSAEFNAPSSKPLSFIAHSLGGILLKYAVVSMANSGAAEVHLLSKIRKVLLFGVPNQGMATDHLLAMIGDQPNRMIIQALAEGSSYLSDLNQHFGRICYVHGIRLISAFETEMTRTAVVSQED